MLDDKSEAYIRGKHMPGGEEVTSDKSIFNHDVDLDQLVEESAKHPAVGPNKSGNYERLVDAGRPIGKLSKNYHNEMPTNWYTVVQDKWGGVITMYPDKDPRFP